MPLSSEENLFEAAKAGSQEALGRLLNEVNPELHRLAQRDLGPQLQARLSAADLVQQTCLSAIRSFQDFEGDNQPQFMAWLREVHDRNVKDAVRRHAGAQKRRVSDEITMAEEPQLTDEKSPGSQAAANESAFALREAIVTLPEDQATAVRLRHLEQRSLQEIALAMNRSEVAVAALLKRGLASLRTQFGTKSKES